MIIHPPTYNRKSANKSIFPQVQSHRISGRSCSMSHNMNNQTGKDSIKNYKQLTVPLC